MNQAKYKQIFLTFGLQHIMRYLNIWLSCWVSTRWGKAVRTPSRPIKLADIVSRSGVLFFCTFVTIWSSKYCLLVLDRILSDLKIKYTWLSNKSKFHDVGTAYYYCYYIFVGWSPYHRYFKTCRHNYMNHCLAQCSDLVDE